MQQAKKRNTMKSYILKRPVYNSIDFPAGTIVTITDDYWGNGNNYPNTGFTVVEGKLKGKKGCVADGLNGWVLKDTTKNRKLFKQFRAERKKLENSIIKLEKKWNALPTPTITHEK